MDSSSSITLTTQGDLHNQGGILAKADITATANGVNSQLTSSHTSTLAAGVQEDNTIGDAGNITLTASGAIVAQGNHFSGDQQTITGKSVSLSGSDTAANALNVTATEGGIDMSGATVTAESTLALTTTQTLTTDSAEVGAETLAITARSLSNVQGELQQTGQADLAISLAGDLDNTEGTIATNSAHLNVEAAILVNTRGVLSHAGTGKLDIDAATLTGEQGQIVTNGDLDITAATLTLNRATTTSQGRIAIDSETFNHQQGTMIQAGDADGSIVATTILDNTDGLIATNGNLTTTAGDVINQGGTIQVTGQVTDEVTGEVSGTTKSLTINASGVIDNQAKEGTKGDIYADNNVSITAASLDNSQSRIAAANALAITTTSNVDNTSGTLAANQTVTVNASEIDNTQGNIGSVNADAQLTATTGQIDNTQGRIEAATEITITSQGLDNDEGVILAAKQAINTGLQALSNERGQIIANGIESTDTLTITSGALNNDQGLIQAKAAINIDTQGNTLTNTNSGNDKGIIGQQSSITLTTGDLNNQSGYIGSAGDLEATSENIDNSQNGILLSETQMQLTGTALDNNTGKVQATDALTINLGTGQLTNTSGLIRSGGHADVTAGTVLNNTTQGIDQGLEANSLSVTASESIDNTEGVIRANAQLTLAAGTSINNTRGLVSSANHDVILQDTDLANNNLTITNTDGTLVAGQTLDIDSHSLSGDGNLYSEGDIDIALTSTYTHTGDLVANGNAKLHTTGNIDNHSTMSAGQLLDLQAATLDTQAGSELIANSLKLSATDSNTFNNRGLIDGVNTEIDTITLNNLGTGRIYGDHVSISATTVNNEEENGVAAVIAARIRLDIGAQTINNRDHSLIFSAGDMAIGGALDGDRHATGQATTLNNYSATIESLGDMSLSAGVINNVNTSITTATQTLTPTSLSEYKLNSGDVVKPVDKTTRHTSSEVTPYICEGSVKCLSVNATGDKSDAYTQYNITRTISQTVVTSSDPAQILSGGNLILNAGTTNNDKSQIIAGANISLNGGTVNNTSATGNKTTADSGTATSYWRDRIKNSVDTSKSSSAPYTPAPVVQTISIAPAVYEANTAVSGTGTQVAAYTNDSDTPTIDSVSGNDSARTGGGLDRIIRFTNNDDKDADGPPDVLTGGINLSVTNNGLFTSDSDAPNGYVVETDPAFASYRNWLSSDYLLSAVSTDPSTVQQRLGDGFYEQRLIREQVAMLTGRRFLENYSDDEQQYQQLMEDGALFAQAYELRPGVGLSAEQMAQLTSDIVWLVEKTIMLADGQTIQALVPQVYVRVQDGDLSASGGLIAADNSLELNISNDLNNFGTIAGRQIADISADNINNLGGRLRGDDVTLTAARDINIIGGRVDAGSRLAAFAGNDIFVESTTRSQAVASSQVGSEPTNGIGFKKTFNKPQYTVSSTNTRTNIDRVAGLYVSDSNGLLTASAGRDLILKAAGVDSAGSAQLLAGNDVRLETVTTAADTRVTWDSNNYNREYSQTEVGSSIQSRDDLQIQAERDLLARAAEVGSLEGALEATAGGNIEITAGEHTDGLDAASKHTSKGTFSSRTLTTRDDIQQTTLQSSSFSGRTVNLQAGQDVVLTGSDVLADAGVSITAGNDITIESGQQRYVDNSERIDKKSGLMSGGSFGVTAGSRQQTDQIDQTRVSQRASTVGSLSGDVTLDAGTATAPSLPAYPPSLGGNVTITSSDLLARDGDIAISGDNVRFIADDDTFAQDEVHKFKQSGLTLALSGGAVDTLKTIQRSTERIEETDNSRLGALHAWQAGKAAQALPGQIDSLSSLGDDFSDPTNINTDAEGNPQGSGVNLSISLGSSKSEQRRQIRQSNAQGSTVFASGDLTVTARGDSDRAGSGDITAQGALLQGSNVTLDAADEITLQSAENHQSDDSQSKSSSVGIGISIGSGGLNFYVEASKSKGFTNKSDDQYLESQIIGSNNVTLRSGSDTTLEGAQVRGESITADIGGDLNIVSQQDRSTFEQENKTMGFKAQYGTDSGVSASMSELEARANYLAVQEQTGLFAGDDGFDIDVAGNTALTGGVIVSTADAGDNRISTESLTAKQINNTTEYSVESMSISVGNIGGNSLNGGAASDSDSQSNTTYSALSEGAIDIRNGDTSALATIKGSEAEAHTVLENNFNQGLITDVQDQLEAQLMAGELVGAAVQDYAESQLAEAKALDAQAKEAKDAGNEVEASSLQAQADEIKADWGKDSRQRNIATAVISGALGGNLSQTLASATSQELFREVGDLYQDLENAEAWLKEAEDNPNEYSSKEIELRQEALDKAREDIVIPKELAHAIAGGISASLTGGNVAEGALAAGVNEFINQELNDLTPADSSTRNLLATAVGGAIGGSDGAIITNTADTFNRQLHPTEVKFVDEQVEAYASDKNISPEEARKLLLRGAVYDSDFDWQEVYEDYTPEQVAAYKEANDYLASIAKNEGLTFTNELGQQQLAFTSTDDQRSNSKLFLSTFTDDSVKETYTEYAKPEQGILDSIAGGFGTAAGNSIGGATGAFEGAVVDTVDSVVTLPETLIKLSEGGKAAYDLYQNDPEKFKNIVKGLPEDVKAAIENEINAFYNEGFLLETQRKDYAAAEHLTSGETRQAIGVVNPFRKLKILEIVANASDKFKIKVPEDIPKTTVNQHVDIVSPETRKHILDGDGPGSGGHLWPGQEGKTPFPKDWNGDKVIHEVGDITTSPSTKWFAQTGSGGKYTKSGKPAKWVAWEVRDGVRVRVVFEPATGRVVTGFPDNAPIPKLKPIE
ncbi:MAG: filamentous hemagglutinin [Candidatus Endobugula sp.]|jgi:filamentous hemagglutinin